MEEQVNVDAVERYIELTPMTRSQEMAYSLMWDAVESFEGTFQTQGIYKAILRAFEYGRAKGLRMGRAEAKRRERA